MKVFVRFSAVVFLVILGLLCPTYSLVSHDFSSCKSKTKLKLEFVKYLKNDLNTSFRICHKLLEFKEQYGRDIRAITCEIDPTNNDAGKLCMIRATYLWVDSTIPIILQGNRGSGIICVSYRNISDIPSTILGALNMFEAVRNSTTDHCCLRNQTGMMKNPDFWTNLFSDVTLFNSSSDDVVIKMINPFTVESHIAYYVAYDVDRHRTKSIIQCLHQQFDYNNSTGRCLRTKSDNLVYYLLRVFLIPNY